MSPSLDSAVTLDELIQAVSQKRVPLAAELAGYLVLEILSSGPPEGDIDPARTYVSEEGTVAFVRPKGERGEGDTESSSRKLLGRLLEIGGSKTPALSATAGRTSSDKALTSELEAALIPLNRAAGRRALARIARDVRRITQGIGRNASVPPTTRRASSPSFTNEAPTRPRTNPGELTTLDRDVLPPLKPPSLRPPSAEEASEIDALLEDRAVEDIDALISNFEVSGENTNDQARQLKAVAGLDPTPPPPSADLSVDELLDFAESRKPVSRRDAQPETLDEVEASLPPPNTVRSAESPSSRAGGRSDARAPRGQVVAPLVPAVGRRREAPANGVLPADAPISPRPKKKRRALDVFLLGAIVLLLAVAAGLMWKLKPGTLSGRTQDVVDRELAEASARAAIPPPKACRTQIAIKDIPKDAEVLLRVGTAPLDVPNLQAGTRLEFVATLEGYAPRRTVVTKESWDKGPDGKPRAEAAVQLDKTRARASSVDPWPAGDPGTEIGGKGPPGSVHIVATPRAAEVWLLMALNPGTNPDAKVELAGCKGDVELLVAGPGTYRKRIPMKEADFVATPDLRSLNVSGR